MKKMMIGSFVAVFAATSFAEHLINTDTNTWKNIPIIVDKNKNTYTTSDGFLMPEGDYYYSYSGYRCLKDKTDLKGVKPVLLKALNRKGVVIYCYPEKYYKK
ncbi:MAG TPA: hypothetical protein DDY37_08455 [Legionella sp.]|nr:hypothetical protein [Legionella sp.]